MRILVVEDDKKIANFIKRGLKEESYAVDVAYDGEEGHFLATTNDYDLVLLDLMIPKMDGITLCKKLRGDKVTVPVIMLTAKDELQDKVEGFNSGADDYLTKPFAFEELLARVRAHSRRKLDAAPTRHEVGDLTLDLLSHKIERANKEIFLTTKEYALLEYLMRHAGEVVTRTMISEHVWDVHFDVATNAIEVYINYLRSKVDQGHKKKLIHTIRGRGYMLKG
jgi:heavy metal response regulator